MKKKILIIEDDNDVRADLQTLFEEESFEVLAASNGGEGIYLAERFLPDLIICDILMNGLNGYDVLKKLSQTKETSGIPFIFLTAKIEQEDLRKGMELGADDYIFKPFTSEDLLKAVNTRLKKYEVLKTGIFAKVKKERDNGTVKKKLTENDRFFLDINNKPEFIKVNEIKLIKAENQYSKLYMHDNRLFLTRKALTSWEKVLPPELFLRIHRSTVVNMNFILKVEKWYGSSFRIYLREIEEPFVISRRYSSKIRTHL